MDEKQERTLRRKAIRLTLRGLKPQQILKHIPRSRAWLYRWQRRFDHLGWPGLKSHSRRPHQPAHQYDEHVGQVVIRTRRSLEKRTIGLVGPKAIQRELRQGRLLRCIPALTTIKRMLRAAGLTKATAPAPPPVYFPHPTPTQRYVLHMMDWTARYLEGGEKVFAFHTIDCQTRAFKQTIATDKTTATVCAHALEVWQTLGLPHGLQLDNDAAFCGGYKAPRVFGHFVRLCLYLGIEPIFIPVGEAKRNGLVERLNGLWSQSFWQRRRFHSPAQVKRASPDFEAWYTHHYEPPPLQGQTPAQAQRDVSRQRLRAQQTRALPIELPITAGRLHFLRYVTPDGQITLLNETWHVDKRLTGQYVWATLVTHEQRLRIYHRRSPQARVRLVKTFPYAIPETVVPLRPEFTRPYRRRNMFTML